MKLLCALIVLPFTLSAVPIGGAGLSFEGLKNGEQVLAYYAGGFGGNGSGPGPNYGVSFTSGLAADSTQITFGPSAVVTAPSVTMNLDSPWSQVLSFYFVGNGTVSFYTGPNGTGNLLQSIALVYPPFFPFSATPGPFESAVFTPAVGTALRLDSISFGATVLPEPSVLSLMGLAAMLAGGLRWYRAKHRS